jgi:hypothetical protein
MERVVVDVQTGEVAVVPFTQSEREDILRTARAHMDSLTYKDLRAAEYPPFAEQFDLLYHEGYDAWRAAIQEIKNKYPKPAG